METTCCSRIYDGSLTFIFYLLQKAVVWSRETKVLNQNPGRKDVQNLREDLQLISGLQGRTQTSIGYPRRVVGSTSSAAFWNQT